jgi:hypothetical protein
MRRILLDQNAPVGLRSCFPADDVRLAREMGWATLENGELILAAERAGFDVLITADRNIRHQQNVSGRTIALIALGIGRWSVVKTATTRVVEAVDAARPGTCTEVPFERPPLRRRPFDRERTP